MLVEDPPGAEGPGDDELLQRVASSDERSPTVRAAQAWFYRRHVRYLYGVLLRRESTLANVAGVSVEDLVQETFQRAFLYAGSYRAGGSTREDERRRVRAWLGRIAQNLVLDLLAQPAEESATPFLDTLVDDSPHVDDEPPSSSPRLRAMRRALDELSAREQDVLRITALYQRTGADNQRLPNDVAAELATRWGTNSQNIRAIRSRAMKKLQSCLKPFGLGAFEEEGK